MEILKIENKAGKVKLNESVYKESVDKLLEEIGSVFGARAVAEGQDFGVLMNCAENAADTMEFEIHSPGGSILDGYRVYQAIMDLRGRGVHVTAFINSLAASMASVIAMAADQIKIVKGGRMMIHEASTATYGNAQDHARVAKLLDEMSGEIAGIYADRTGKPLAEMRDRMKEETWMSAEKAVEEGFADEVVSGKFDTKPKAEAMNLLDRLTSPSNEEAILKIEALENAAKAHESEVGELTGRLTLAENSLQEAVTGWQEAKARVAELEALAAKVPTLEAELETAKASAKQEASRLLATTGLPEALVTEPVVNGEVSKTPHIDALAKLEGVAASQYFEKHREDIRAEYNSQS